MSIEMFSRIMGQGHPLLILHGLYGMSDNWLPIARPLSEQFTVHLPDWRNHGQSSHTNSHTYSDLVQDLKLYAASHGLERFILLGHSMGGKAAMRFALENPELISALVVVDIAPVDYSRRLGKSSLLQHQQIIEAMLSFDLERLASRADAEQKLLKEIGDLRVVRFLLKNLQRTNDGFSWKLNLHVLKQFIKEIGSGIDPLSVNPANSFPVLFVAGSDSDYITNDDIPLIRRLFPFAKITTIADASHWVHADQPEAFLETVKQFLR